MEFFFRGKQVGLCEKAKLVLTPWGNDILSDILHSLIMYHMELIQQQTGQSGLIKSLFG